MGKSQKFLSAISNEKVFNGYIDLIKDASPFLRDNYVVNLNLLLDSENKIVKVIQTISYIIHPIGKDLSYSCPFGWSGEIYEKITSVRITHNNTCIFEKNQISESRIAFEKHVINLSPYGENKIEIVSHIENIPSQDSNNANYRTTDYIRGKHIIIVANNGSLPIRDLYECKPVSYSPQKIEDKEIGSDKYKYEWNSDSVFLPYQGTSIEISKK